jgi:UDP-N-acetylmuramoylalanine--D-glutamate ligase
MSGLLASSTSRMILGLGETGRSVARWFVRHDIPFLATDTRPEQLSAADVLEAVGSPNRLVSADKVPELMGSITELVVSPGISLEHPWVALAREAGARILGDIDLFAAEVTAPVVGITGSNGKSTVAALLAQMIAACGKRVGLGGNIGIPALDIVGDNVDCYVLELSSFQLERSEPLHLTVATVLNVTEDHLDRHGSLPKYHLAKHMIFRGAKAVVVNRSDPLTQPLLDAPVDVVVWRPGEPDLKEWGIRDVEGRPTICFGFDPVVAVDALCIHGAHNVNNALVALALGTALRLPVDGLVSGLLAFKGLPHRCELVADADGVRWINDSKGTNVGACIAALEGLGGVQDVVLILGGQGKQQDFSVLAPAVQSHCRRVITLGEAARELELALGHLVPVNRASTLEDAVARAADAAESGDVVLLSPACASFDMFAGYAARGDAFRSAVLTSCGVAA